MQWLKAFLYLVILAGAYILAPDLPLDAWGLFNLKKILSMILALSVIHFLGVLLVRTLGLKLGLLFTGLFGGFVSSTATTASLARKSQDLSPEQIQIESITYLSATLAMLSEAIILIAIGTGRFLPQLYLLFVTPVLITLILIVHTYKKFPADEPASIKETEPSLSLRPILKLAAFIICILALSKLLQHLLGQNGLMVLTFLVSLFEIHGSLIANIQLHENTSISTEVLATLISLSVLASYLSKMFLIHSMGNPSLKKTTTKWTLMILTAFIASSVLIHFIVF